MARASSLHYPTECIEQFPSVYGNRSILVFWIAPWVLNKTDKPACLVVRQVQQVLPDFSRLNLDFATHTNIPLIEAHKTRSLSARFFSLTQSPSVSFRYTTKPKSTADFNASLPSTSTDEIMLLSIVRHWIQ